MPPQQLPYKRPFFQIALTPQEIEVHTAEEFGQTAKPVHP